MHGYNVHEAFYLKCDIDDPWDKDSGPSVG